MLFEKFVYFFHKFGVVDFYLPFLLTFSMFYALLQKTKIFGEGDKVNAINAIISLVAAFYVIGYTPVGYRIAEFLMPFFTQVTVVLVGLLGASLIIGMASGKGVLHVTDWMKKSLTVFLIAASVFIFFTSGGPQVFGLGTGGGIWLGITAEDLFFISLIVVTLIIILVVAGWSPFKRPGEGGETKEEKT